MGDSVPGSNGTWILAFDILSSPIRALLPLKLGWKLSAPKLRCCRLCRSVLRGILEFRHSPECLGSPGMCPSDSSHPVMVFPSQIPVCVLDSSLLPFQTGSRHILLWKCRGKLPAGAWECLGTILALQLKIP